MYDRYRKYLYKNKNKFNLDYNMEDECISVEIDLSKSCAHNKKKIEKALPEKRLPGIWIIIDSSDSIKKNSTIETYEVLSTSDIKEEMIKDLQFIYLGIRDSRKNIYNNFSRNVYRRYKYQQIYKTIKAKTKRGHAPTLVFKHIITEPIKDKREDVELKIALDLEAVWWSSNPKQSKYIQKVLGVSADEFKKEDGR